MVLSLKSMGDQDKVIALGDFNARVATPQLKGNYYQYHGVRDDVINEHGRTLLNICHNNGLTVANYLYCDRNTLGGDSATAQSISTEEITEYRRYTTFTTQEQEAYGCGPRRADKKTTRDTNTDADRKHRSM